MRQDGERPVILPLGVTTISNDLVFTTLFEGDVVAFHRDTGAIVFNAKLTRTANSPIAIAGNTLLVPAGGTKDGDAKGPSQLIAYALPTT